MRRRPIAAAFVSAALALLAGGGCRKPATTSATSATAPVAPGQSIPFSKPGAPGSLGVGSPAPGLAPVRYLTKVGGPAELKTGQVYVIDFWATWCGPCIQAMPHLAELQAKYAGKGVTVIALASPQDAQELTDTEEFAEREGERLKIAIALESQPTNYAAYFLAAKQRGIPCTFVINRDGKVAYIGHPMEVDAKLGAIVAKGG